MDKKNKKEIQENENKKKNHNKIIFYFDMQKYILFIFQSFQTT